VSPKQITSPLSRMGDKILVTETCWLWTGGTTTAGYGLVGRGGRGNGMVLAHRVMYESVHGTIPDGLEIDHLCRVIRCVNPDHLEAVTHQVNINRGITATKTYCKHGHEFTSANTYIKSNGCRQCRECSLASSRRQRPRLVS